jgi:hypothetical protein
VEDPLEPFDLPSVSQNVHDRVLHHLFDIIPLTPRGQNLAGVVVFLDLTITDTGKRFHRVPKTFPQILPELVNRCPEFPFRKLPLPARQSPYVHRVHECRPDDVGKDRLHGPAILVICSNIHNRAELDIRYVRNRAVQLFESTFVLIE